MSYQSSVRSDLGFTTSAIYDYVDGAQAIAHAALAASPGSKFAVVEIETNGGNPKTKLFGASDEAAATAYFEATMNTPSAKRKYLGMFDESSTGPWMSQFFGATDYIETTWSINKFKSLAVPILVGAVLIGAALYFGTSSKKRPVPAKARKRRTSAWRRRVTTTWR